MRIFSADAFFTEGETGIYRFERKSLREAHGACLRGYVEALTNGAARVTIMRGIPGAGKTTWALSHADELDVVVDNTATTAVEVAPYVALAEAFRVPFELILVQCDVSVAAARCTHSVPRKSIERSAVVLYQSVSEIPRRWPTRVVGD